MKILISLLMFCLPLLGVGQNFISLKNDKVIKKAILHKVYEKHIEYIQHGSLHDLNIIEISFIQKGDTIIKFNKKEESIKKDSLHSLQINLNSSNKYNPNIFNSVLANKNMSINYFKNEDYESYKYI